MVQKLTEPGFPHGTVILCVAPTAFQELLFPSGEIFERNLTNEVRSICSVVLRGHFSLYVIFRLFYYATKCLIACNHPAFQNS